MSEITLKINNKTYRSWPSLHMIRSFGSVTGIIEVNNMDFFQGAFDKFDIKMGDEIVVDIEGQIVLTGYIEEIIPDKGMDNLSLQILARDKTGDLVDCPFKYTPNEWKNQTVGNLIKNICSPFSINVTIDKSIVSRTNIIVPTYKADEGKEAVHLIMELCRDYQIIPYSKGDGKLTLSAATTTEKTKDDLVLDQNAYRGKLIASNINRFSEYTVKGQGIGSDNKSIADWTEPIGFFSDPVITRFRPSVIFSDTATDSGKCINRAKWEARIMAGQSRMPFYEVINWTQSNGKIWDINTLVSVTDDWHGIKGDFLIDKVEYIRNEEEQDFTRIWVVDSSTYSLSDTTIGIKTGYDR